MDEVKVFIARNSDYHVLQDKVEEQQKEIEKLNKLINSKVSDIDFYWTTLLQIGKIARECDNDIIYEIVSSVVEKNFNSL